MFAGAIPHDRHDVPMIRHAVQAKPVPSVVRQQRIDLDDVVVARHEAGEAADNQIVECGVIVVAAALGFGTGDEPLARLFIQILSDVGLAVLSLAARIGN